MDVSTMDATEQVDLAMTEVLLETIRRLNSADPDNRGRRDATSSLSLTASAGYGAHPRQGREHYV